MKGDGFVTDLQYALLVKIRDNQPYDEDLLSRDEQLILNECVRNRWVYFNSKLYIVMSSRGEYAMLEREYEMKNQSEREAQQERERVRGNSLRRVEQANANRLSWVQLLASALIDVVRSVFDSFIH